ncbi:plasmid mobilization relaxosome protein MobC [Sphingobacterium siyangense]|uniref:plasmid mobilization relaxosome protein MobC n=1 Tax=Sphingobacterium siyangense TaxID=459529 RepID=UPI003DA5291C
MIDGKKIKCFYRDLSLQAPLEEMAMIRKELRAIGININQITRSFNSEKSSESARAYYVMKVADLYQKVDLKVERLLELIGKLAERWFNKRLAVMH